MAQRVEGEVLRRVGGDCTVTEQAIQHDERGVGGHDVRPVGERDQPRGFGEVDLPVLDDLAVLAGRCESGR